MVDKRIDAVSGDLSRRLDMADNKMDAVSNDLNRRLDMADNKMDTVSSDLNKKLDNIDKKTDDVRDRVSRIEGRLMPTKFMSFEGVWSTEGTERKSVSR